MNVPFFKNDFIPQHQPSSTLLMFKDLQQAPLGIEDPLGIEAFLGVFMVFSAWERFLQFQV